jgi:N-acetylmuramoyl-L-alanine amidase
MPTPRWAVVCATILLGAWGRLSARRDRGYCKRVPGGQRVRVGSNATQTRLVVDFNQKIDIHAFTLANPYRVVIDMPQVNFQFPARTGESGRGLIKAFRYGLVMQGGSRIVIDLAKPARIDRAFVLESSNDQPARLILDWRQLTARRSCVRAPRTGYGFVKAAPCCGRPTKGDPGR